MKTYKKVSRFLKNVDLSDFPLVNYYLDYDDCYKDDSWIEYTVFTNNKKEVECIIAERKPKNEIRHILILEVNKNYLGKGLGKKYLSKYMNDYPYWELFSVETAEGFYKKMGFKQYNDTFYYGVDLG